MPEQVASSSQRRSTWWGPSELQWQNYRIENMPSRTKPLLVFVNTKSGPMLGHMLRRKFLRLLNPLQVGVLLYFACADLLVPKAGMFPRCMPVRCCVGQVMCVRGYCGSQMLPR